MDAISEAEAKVREVSVTTDLSGANAEIRVSDTGPGMAVGDLKNVFKPFFTTKPKGMGMGLAICRSIAEAHHGKLWASPGVRSGAIFHLILPAAAPPEEGPQGKPDEARRTAPLTSA